MTLAALRIIQSLIRQDDWLKHVIDMLLTQSLCSSYAPPLFTLLIVLMARIAA